MKVTFELTQEEINWLKAKGAGVIFHCCGEKGSAKKENRNLQEKLRLRLEEGIGKAISE